MAPAQEDGRIPAAFLSCAPRQSGFCPLRSVETRLVNVANGLCIAGVKGPFYVIISLDSSVTPDTQPLTFSLKKTFPSASVTSFSPILSPPSSLGTLSFFSLDAPHILVLLCTPCLIRLCVLYSTPSS